MYDSYTSPIRSTLKFTDLKNLIKTGENTFLEFKRMVPSPEKIAREMAAMANTKGGTLLIGVDDDKTIIGVESYYEQHFLLDEAASYLCEPPIVYQDEVMPFNKRDVVIVKIKEADVKPVMVEHSDGKKRGYVRVNDKSVTASREMLKVLANRTSDRGVTFEFGPNEQKLFRFLNEYERITVKEFSDLVNIGTRRASRILVNLVSAGILHLFTNEKSDYYTLVRPI